MTQPSATSITVSPANYDEAVAIWPDCPHLSFGGRIELREIEIP